MKRKKLIISIAITVIVAAAIVGGIMLQQARKPLPYEFVTITKQNIIQEVSVTGRVKAADAVDLAFEKSGRVANVYVEINDMVEAGDPLVVLNSSELQAQLREAKAQLEIQQANLQTLQKGTRAEELDVLRTKVANAQKAISDSQTNLTNIQSKAFSDLANLYDSIANILQSAYALADDAVNKQTDDLFSNDLSDNPHLTFQVSNSQNKITVEQGRVASRDGLKDLKAIIDGLTSDYSALDTALSDSEQKLNTVRDFLTALTEALNSTSDLPAATITAYKGYVNAGRTNVITAVSNVNTQRQAIATQEITNRQNIATAQAGLNTAQNTLNSAQKDLELKQAGATSEQISEQEAQIKSAQANIENLEIQISKVTLRSPISGTITKQNAKVGQIITANSNVVSVISKARFQVEANIPEADIAKVSIGNSAKITLDAYGSDIIFEATVIKIDPAETVIEGVPTYKATFEFKEDNEKIKPGMTANIDILTAGKENTLVVPYRAVINKNGDKIVRVINPSAGSGQAEFIERKVILGLRGSDGNIEILEGLEEGEKVITFEKKQ